MYTRKMRRCAADGWELKMSASDKKAKILSAIEARGWFTADVYLNEANELRADGLIRMGERFSTGGNRKAVWVSA